MTILLASSWWSLVLRGAVGILVGLITFVWPGITLASLVILFGAYAFVDGVLGFWGAIRASRAHERWVALLIEGVIGVLAGIVTLAWPAITALALVYVIAAWAIVTGVFEIMAAVQLRKHIAGEWLLVLGGVASIAFGILVMAVPMAGALVIALWVGVYAFIFGFVLVGLGFRLRNWSKKTLEGGTSIPLHAR
jgi:uncharacterized membrane protein HdeD (DUF308 family)